MLHNDISLTKTLFLFLDILYIKDTISGFLQLQTPRYYVIIDHCILQLKNQKHQMHYAYILKLLSRVKTYIEIYQAIKSAPIGWVYKCFLTNLSQFK